MAVVDEEKQAAIYELKSKFDSNNAKLKQVCFLLRLFFQKSFDQLPQAATDKLTMVLFFDCRLNPRKKQMKSISVELHSQRPT